MTSMRLSASVIAFSLIAILCTGSARAAEPDIWPGLKTEVFGARPIVEATDVIVLSAPDRAEDAALVPLSFTVPAHHAARVTKVTLLIDQNPAPVAAVISFGEAAGAGERRFATRVRVDRYSFVRAIAEMDDGSLHMTARFVKASGGCSAPASKDAELALQGIGRMNVSRVGGDGGAGEPAEAQVMIRHPNFSGLQMDHETRAYTPARFVQSIVVTTAGRRVLSVEGGISISENPHLRFTYDAHVGEVLDVDARDTEGALFRGKMQPSGS